MENLTTPPKVMPGRNHHLVSRFDERPVALSRFLKEVEQLAEDCGLMAKQTIDWMLHYVPDDQYNLWEMQTAVEAAD